MVQQQPVSWLECNGLSCSLSAGNCQRGGCAASPTAQCAFDVLSAVPRAKSHRLDCIHARLKLKLFDGCELVSSVPEGLTMWSDRFAFW